MDEKTNFSAPDSSSLNPIKTDPIKIDSPGNDLNNMLTGKPDFNSSHGSDIKPPENPLSASQTGSPLNNPLVGPETKSIPKVSLESAFDQKNQDMPAGLSGRKKSHAFLWTLGVILLILISAAGSGYGVYYAFSKRVQPLVKERALLQGEVGSLKSRVDVLSKEKTNLESEVTLLEEELKAQISPPAVANPEIQPGANVPGQPIPNVPENPVTPGQ